jgi:hypothetical protein
MLCLRLQQKQIFSVSCDLHGSTLTLMWPWPSCARWSIAWITAELVLGKMPMKLREPVAVLMVTRHLMPLGVDVCMTPPSCCW